MSRVSYEGWEPPHLSYSTVNGYIGCGKRTQLEKVFRLESKPSYAAVGGVAVHRATELYDLAEYLGQPLNDDFLAEHMDQAIHPFNEGVPGTTQLFLRCWGEAVAKAAERSPSFDEDDFTVTGRAAAKYGGKKTGEWWFDEGPKLVQQWIDWRQSHLDWRILDLNGLPGIELEINALLPGDLPVKMFLDRVFVLESGQVVVVDLKTGRTPETGEQLGLYRVGLGLMFDLWPDWGYYWTPSKWHDQPIPLLQYTPDYFAKQHEQAIAGMNAGMYLPHPQNGCAKWCGVSRFCAAVGGSEAAGNDPLAAPSS